MNGVEILSQSEVVTVRVFNWVAFSVITVILFVAIGIGTYLLARMEHGSSKTGNIAFSIFVALILSFMIGGLICGATATPIAYETHYKVTIDDSVSMNEFLDKYEILDQEGKIYTVKEKEQ